MCMSTTMILIIPSWWWWWWWWWSVQSILLDLFIRSSVVTVLISHTDLHLTAPTGTRYQMMKLLKKLQWSLQPGGAMSPAWQGWRRMCCSTPPQTYKYYATLGSPHSFHLRRWGEVQPSASPGPFEKFWKLRGHGGQLHFFVLSILGYI